MDTVYQWIAPAKLVQIKKEGNEMKKLFLTVAMTIIISTPAMSACDAGKLSDDGQFCISNIEHNWWSASNWCKANGRHLATMYEVCPDWDGNEGSRKCPVIASSIGVFAFTATTSGHDGMFGIRLSDGTVDFSVRNNTGRAICK